MNKIVLKASAGTGKTYRLSIEYIVSLLKGSFYNEILVLTFTKKATGEIRERIIEFIEDILYKNNEGLIKSVEERLEKPLDKGVLESIYRDMVKNKEGIKIYTIDSFINQIFKKIIGPHLNIYSFEMINDDKNIEYYGRVLNEILQDKKHFAELKEFFKDNSERKIENYHKFIKSFIDERWKLEFIKREKREKLSYDEPKVYIPKLMETLENAIKAKGSEKTLDYMLAGAFKNLFNCDENKINQTVYGNLTKILEANNFFDGRFLKTSKKDSEEFTNYYGLLLELFQKFKEDMKRYVYNEEIVPLEEDLFDFGSYCQTLYDEFKMADKKFTFNDLSYYTFSYFNDENLALVDKGLCSQYLYDILESQIKTVFIDEFQDTSVIQWSILSVFSKTASEVICVGDEKQSIYSWRGGEKRLFEKLEHIIDAQAEGMNTSYRSYGEIIKFVNNYFMSISHTLEEFEWNYNPVEYLSSKEGGFVETHFLGEGNEEQATDRIVSILKDITNYSKVAILGRSKKALLTIGEELELNGIPYINSDNLCIVEHKAIKGIYALLKYLNYKDYIYLLEFLRSDLINIDSFMLKELVQNKQQVESYLNTGEKTFSFNLPALEFVYNLKQKNPLNYKKSDGSHNFYEEIFGSLGLSKKYSSNSDLKNIFRFYEILKSYDSLDELIQYIEENREEESLKQVAVNELNAVTLMTIHKSKGLEYETIIYYIKNSKGSPRSELKLYTEINDSFDFCPNYFYTSSKYLKTLTNFSFPFEKIEDVRKLSEEINTVYVALTRPKKNLFVVYEDRAKTIKDDLFLSSLMKAMKVETPMELDYMSFGKFTETPLEFFEEKLENLFPFMEVFDNKEFHAEELSKSALLNYNTQYTLEKEFKRKLGSATHFYLENISYATEEELLRAKKLTQTRYGNMFGERLLEGVFEDANKLIEKFSWVFSDKYLIQKEFEIYDEDKTYRIDRLVIDKSKNKIWIIDYKTGGKDDKQILNYKDILQKQLGEKYIIETLFLFV